MFDLKILNKEETEKVLKMEAVIEVVESAYSQKADDKGRIFDWVFNAFEPGVADMDIKSGWLMDDGVYGMKLVSWFSQNPGQNLPAIIGVIMVFDDKTGQPIGLVDGSHITGMRTGASGGIGAKYLAKQDSKRLLMVGTGHISKFEVAASLIGLPSLSEVVIYDPRDGEKAKEMASGLAKVLKEEFNVCRPLKIKASSDLESAVGSSDVIITATPAAEPLIKKSWVRAGTHLSCVGADMPGKGEIDPTIMSDARVFVDDLKQCMHIGEIEKAVEMELLNPQDVVGEIGDVINGHVKGRLTDDEITVFDATGTALLDLITAQLAFREATHHDIGVTVKL